MDEQMRRDVAYLKILSLILSGRNKKTAKRVRAAVTLCACIQEVSA